MSSDEINLLHLSDLHFNLDDNPIYSPTACAKRKNCFEPLIDILKGLEEDWKPNIIIISGDISWSGKVEDYINAEDWIKNKLLKIWDLPLNRILICAGNHDLYRDILEEPKYPESGEIADNKLKVENFSEISLPFEEFNTFLRRLRIEPLRLGGMENYLAGYRKILGVNFVILNSAWFSYDKNDENNLWLGLPQLEVMRANNQLPEYDDYDESEIFIGVFHHPHSLLNKEERASYDQRVGGFIYLAKRCHIILTGHLHSEFIEEPTRHYNRAIEFSIGSLYQSNKYFNSFSLLKINRTERTVMQKVFIYKPYKEKWEPNTDDYGPYYLRIRKKIDQWNYYWKIPDIETLSFGDIGEPDKIALDCNILMDIYHLDEFLAKEITDDFIKDFNKYSTKNSKINFKVQTKISYQELLNRIITSLGGDNSNFPETEKEWDLYIKILRDIGMKMELAEFFTQRNFVVWDTPRGDFYYNKIRTTDLDIKCLYRLAR